MSNGLSCSNEFQLSLQDGCFCAARIPLKLEEKQYIISVCIWFSSGILSLQLVYGLEQRSVHLWRSSNNASIQVFQHSALPEIQWFACHTIDSSVRRRQIKSFLVCCLYLLDNAKQFQLLKMYN